MPRPKVRLPPGARSKCPIANALDVLGDKWTLLVIRDLLFLRRYRYGDLARSPEGIPTNILADRLRRLEKHGLVRRTVYQTRPKRFEYRLTARGEDLFPVLREVVLWANRHIPGTGRPPQEFFDRAGVAHGPDSESD